MLGFWINVKEKLEYKNSSQKELAIAINESYNTLQSWINRDRLPDAEQAVKIAKYLNTSVEKLVTGKEIKTNTNDNSKTIQLLESAIKLLKN